MTRMRCGIRAQKRAGETAGNQFAQRLLVNVTLEDRQAVQMWTYTANQHVVTVKHQMLWRDGGGDKLVTVADILSGIFGGDVLEDHFERGKALTQGLHHGVDKTGFTVKDVDLGMRDFTVNQQRHTQFLHTLQHRHDGINAGNAVAGVGGGIGRVKFRSGEYAFVKPALHFVWIQGIGQVAGHQRGEIMARRDGIQNALAIRHCGIDGGDWWHQVRHDNRAAINFAGIRHDGFEHIAIAQMDMPVVRAADFKNLGLCSHGSSGLSGISHSDGCFCRTQIISGNVFVCTLFRKKKGASAPYGLISEGNNDFSRFHLYPFSILFRKRFTLALVFT